MSLPSKPTTPEAPESGLAGSPDQAGPPASKPALPPLVRPSSARPPALPTAAGEAEPAQTDEAAKDETAAASPAAAAEAPTGPSPRVRKPAAPREPPKGCIFQVVLVLMVAALLATLFTAWTPGQDNPGFGQLVRHLFAAALQTPGATPIALQPSPTFRPGAPTPTLTNPNLVGIVAGHWKNDSGAVCADGLTEAQINLEIATRVQKQLKQAGYDVVLLSEFDDRLNNFQAAALVSIHNDSCQFINKDATGYKVASAMATRRPELAARLTACLRARYGAATQLPLHSTSVTRDMTSYHAFSEINENTPAAIIETGFLNLDRELLTQRPDVVAYGVAQGILCYLKDEPISTASPTSPGAPASPVPATTFPATPFITPTAGQ